MRATSDKTSLRNIKLTIAYDGTDFSGWQRQREGTRTVQALIEEALFTLHKEPVTLTGSGRTDSGVHAAAQAANFYTTIGSMEAGRFVPALNSLLPKDIRILSAGEASPDFHARFDARLRTYRYFFVAGRTAMPWEHRYAVALRREPDIDLLNRYAALLRGEMDCSAFAASGEVSLSRSRYIDSASFFWDDGPERKLVFEITANAFLWKMVRSIAGTLMRLEEAGAGPLCFDEIIRSGSRHLSGPTAPPCGLFLWNVCF